MDWDARSEFVRQDILKFEPQERIDILIDEQIGTLPRDEDAVRKLIPAEQFEKNCRNHPGQNDPSPCSTSHQLRSSKVDVFGRRSTMASILGLPGGCSSRTSCGSSALLKSNSMTGKPSCATKRLIRIDFRTVSWAPARYRPHSNWRAFRPTGMCAYFAAGASGNHRTRFSTRPAKTNTHWQILPSPEKKDTA